MLGVHRRGAYRGCMNGEARVKCASQELAENAQMALNMSQVGRRYVEIYLMSKAEVFQLEDLPEPERQHQESLKQVSSCLIRARGLPYKATVADVMEFFSGYVQDQNQILMLTNPDRRPKDDGEEEHGVGVPVGGDERRARPQEGT
ncbi:fus [Symbiodinium sp. KB8]|nr:fus [Symbiodinium sp. KB8]